MLDPEKRLDSGSAQVHTVIKAKYKSFLKCVNLLVFMLFFSTQTFGVFCFLLLMLFFIIYYSVLLPALLPKVSCKARKTHSV